MGFRPHPRNAATDATRPAAWATCQRCGFQWNLEKLRPQYEWAGLKLINTGLLVCPNDYDKPQDQLRSLVLPPDPRPVMNARPEPYSVDEA